MGTRLLPFTSRLPKPLVPVLGVPCIDYSLALLKHYGIQNVVVNVHSHPEQMTNHLAAMKNFKVSISDETTQLLGSAGGFRKALSLLSGDSFFGLNADVITRVDLAKLEAKHIELRKNHGVVMTLAILRGNHLDQNTEKYRELYLDEDSGLIKGFGEKKLNVPFYSGVGVFEKEAFAFLSECSPHEFVPEVLEPWIKKNKVGYYIYDDLWVDIGSPEMWWKSHHEMLKNLQQQPWAELMSQGLKAGHFVLNQPWEGWIKYGKDATPQNFLGKKGIQLDNLCYECKI